MVSVMIHTITIALVIITGFLIPGKIIYLAGALVFFILLVYQHVIVKPGDLSRVNLAFGTTNGIAGLLFSIFVIADLLI